MNAIKKFYIVKTLVSDFLLKEKIILDSLKKDLSYQSSETSYSEDDKTRVTAKLTVNANQAMHLLMVSNLLKELDELGERFGIEHDSKRVAEILTDDDEFSQALEKILKNNLIYNVILNLEALRIRTNLISSSINPDDQKLVYIVTDDITMERLHLIDLELNQKDRKNLTYTKEGKC